MEQFPVCKGTVTTDSWLIAIPLLLSKEAMKKAIKE